MKQTEEYSKTNSGKGTDCASPTWTEGCEREDPPAYTMGLLGFSVQELAVLLETDEEELYRQFRNREGETYKQYMQGRITGRAKVRQTVMAAALNSSSPMLAKMTEYYRQSEKDNNAIWEE